MPPEAEARQSRIRRETEHQRRVLEIATQLSGTLGADFFQSVVTHLANTFEADCAYVAEVAGTPRDRIRTVAVYRGGRVSAGFEQALLGTTSGQVLYDGLFACSKDAKSIFPLDALIQNLEAEAFIGIRLSDSSGDAVGLMALVSKRQFTRIQVIRSVLEAFVPRAVAELERKRTEDVRRQNEERYQAFISNNPDAMWRVEFDHPISLSLSEEQQLDRIYQFGYLAECNAALAKLAGATAVEELLGSRVFEVAERINPSAREELRIAIRTRFRTTTVETTSRDSAGGQLFRLRSQFGIIENGELRRLWGTTRDITILRRTEHSLAASERSFRAVLEGIKLPAVMLDTQGKITFVNECFLGLARQQREDILVATWLRGVGADDDIEMWQKALSPDAPGGRTAFHFEGSIIQADGPTHVIAWDTICLFNEVNELTGLAAIGTDVTRQRVLEQQIRQVQKLESVGRLAAGIAHDFNNLLTIILGNASQLLQSVRREDPARERLMSIEKAAIQSSELTAQLLAFGRKQHMRPRIINLNDVIGENELIIRGLIRDNIALVLDLAEPIGFVMADPAQLQRAIANLVANARDAMPGGGTLTIATSNVRMESGDAKYPGIEPGNYVRLWVSDSGMGLSREIREHIFEPFFTTKPAGKGMGLGLATVYGIVTQSGGHIIVHGDPGAGAAFEILLPESRDLTPE
jgi:signal transduction histidine kinase